RPPRSTLFPYTTLFRSEHGLHRFEQGRPGGRFLGRLEVLRRCRLGGLGRVALLLRAGHQAQHGRQQQQRKPAFVVGRTPWSAADALAGLPRDGGVPRGPGGPPHDHGPRPHGCVAPSPRGSSRFPAGPQILIVPSPLPDARRKPSGLAATAYTQSVCPVAVAMVLPPGPIRRTVLSVQPTTMRECGCALANVTASGMHAPVSIGRVCMSWLRAPGREESISLNAPSVRHTRMERSSGPPTAKP